MSQFQPMETSTLIIFQMLIEYLLDEFYEVPVNVILKFRINPCSRNIYLYDDVRMMLFLQFKVLSQLFYFYLQVSNMVNIVLH